MSSIKILDTIIAQSKLSKKETDKQQKVLEAAIAMFAEKGYANTSTSEIARAAGVSEGTIFRHYGTKENLLLSVILPFIKELVPILAKELEREIIPNNYAGFEEFLRALIKDRTKLIKDNKEIFVIVVKEFLYREDLRKEFIPHLKTEIFQYIHQALELFKARGELADIDNDKLAKNMFMLIGSYLIMQYVLQPEKTLAEEAEELDELIYFILYGVKKW